MISSTRIIVYELPLELPNGLRLGLGKLGNIVKILKIGGSRD